MVSCKVLLIISIEWTSIRTRLNSVRPLPRYGCELTIEEVRFVGHVLGFLRLLKQSSPSVSY